MKQLKLIGDTVLSKIAGEFYDVCTLPEYNVNPALAYAWAALESSWGENAPDYNLFGFATYNGQDSGKGYNSYAESIEDFCKWVAEAADPSSSQYNFNYSRAQEYETVNDKFKGTPDSNIYALFSTYSWVGYTHDDSARAAIRNTYKFLNGVENYECNHNDTEDTTWQERADYMQYQVELRLQIAKDVFGKDVFLGEDGYYQEINDEYKCGIYTSRSGKKYTEWKQTTANDIGNLPMFTEGKVMGNYGCNVYGYTALISSVVDVHLRDVYTEYMSIGYQDNEKTINNVLAKNNIDAETVYIGNNYDLFVSTLCDGKGILVWVGNGYNCLYTTAYHWIVVADIRDSQLGSYMGYDVYVLTSGGIGDSGHGWQPIETVVNNLGPGSDSLGYYIND